MAVPGAVDGSALLRDGWRPQGRLVVRANWTFLLGVFYAFFGFVLAAVPLPHAHDFLHIVNALGLPGLCLTAAVAYWRVKLVMDESGLLVRSGRSRLWLPWAAIHEVPGGKAIEIRYQAADGTEKKVESDLFRESSNSHGSPKKRARTIAEINAYRAAFRDASAASGHVVREKRSQVLVWLMVMFFLAWLVPGVIMMISQ